MIFYQLKKKNCLLSCPWQLFYSIIHELLCNIHCSFSILCDLELYEVDEQILRIERLLQVLNVFIHHFFVPTGRYFYQLIFFFGSIPWSLSWFRDITTSRISIIKGVFSSIVHELGHALGMIHPMSRDDRDQYITLRAENINNGSDRNFLSISDRGYMYFTDRKSVV